MRVPQETESDRTIFPIMIANDSGITIIIMHQKQILSQNAASLNVSPLIFGTNLGLFNDRDLFLTHKVQSEVQQLHVQIIRFPIRNYTPNNIELQAAQIIKNLGITPLVTLSISAPDPVAAGRVTIQDMNQIFGNNIVYYELGNESDLHGYSDPVKYTHYWNQVISQLISLPVKGQFIGPVTLHILYIMLLRNQMRFPGMNIRLMLIRRYNNF